MALKACGRVTSLDRFCRLIVGILLLIGSLLSFNHWFYFVLAIVLLFSACTGQCLMARWIKEVK